VLTLHVAGLARHDLLITDQSLTIDGLAIAVWIPYSR